MSNQGSSERVLICSDRPEVCRELRREFEGVSVTPIVAGCREEWPDEPPTLTLLDLADPDNPVREACLEYGTEGEVWALADQSSAERLLAALAAGCADYLFYPINPDELRLRWRKHVGRHERPVAEDLNAVGGVFRLEFPSEICFVPPVVEQVVGACDRLAVSGSRATLNLRVAMGEALSNAILYGNREDPEKRVTVEAEILSRGIRVSIADEGEGFDPSSVPNPTTVGTRERSHGRGIFLLKELMDEVTYNDVGNRVTLVLRSV